MKSRHTPMIYVLVPLVLGVVVASSIDFSLPLSVGLLVPLLLLLYFVQWRWVVYPIIFAAALLLYSLRESSPRVATGENLQFALTKLDGNEAEVVALRGEADSLWSHQQFRVICSGEASDVERYTTIICRGSYSPLTKSNNKYIRSLLRKGYVGRLYITAYKIVDPASIGLRVPLSVKLNNWAMERLQRLGLSDESFASAAAMALARREYMSEETTQFYRRSGTQHILALSGFHFGIVLIVISVATYLLPLLRNGHIYANFIAIVAIWLFAFIAGMGASVQRAAWMFSLLHFAFLASRRYNSLNALFGAAVLILIFDPTSVFDVGYCLSILAVFAIIWVGVPLTVLLHSRFGVVNFVVKGLVIGAVATLATLPLVSYTFGNVALLSPIATIPLLLTLTVIVLASIVWVIFPLAFLAPLFAYVIEVAVTIQTDLVEWFSYLNIGYYKYQMSLLGLLVSYATFVCIVLIIKNVHSRRSTKLL